MIREKHKIGDYLASKNIFPEKSYGDRDSYICPIHEDTKPSFIVYPASNETDHESYFCFGCKRSGCIISLKAEIEKISWRESISLLAKNVNITESGEIDFLLRSLKIQIDGEDLDDSSEIGRLSLNISTIGFLHAQKVEKDIEEIRFLEKLYKKIDNVVDEDDLDSMVEIYEFISDRKIDGFNPFEYRYQKLEEKKTKEMQELTRVYNSI